MQTALPRRDAGSLPLVDRFGRVVDDLRVSVTDRCNFRCTYCMPAEGVPGQPRGALLTYAEIVRLVGILGRLGIRKVRLTGGEPLVRADVEVLVRMLGEAGVDDLALTTNGYLLAEKAPALAAAGLRRVNVSVDSLLRHRFAEMTRRDALDRVLEGLRAAEAAGLTPVKVNCVVVRGTNDDEVVDFAAFARRTGYEVRFVEVMPLDADGEWTSDKVVAASEILAAVERAYPLKATERGADPAAGFRFADGSPGGIGVISSVTDPFCGSCNRIRLTADGHVRACLFALEETDLLAMLRGGACDDEIETAVRATVDSKWAGHSIGTSAFVRPRRTMSGIGG